MSETITVSSSELWRMLQERGYTIIISKFDSGDGKSSHLVTLDSRFSTQPYTLPTTYGPGYTENEIIMLVLPRLLRWSGLKLKATLDY